MGFCQLLKKAPLAGAFFVPAIWLAAAQAGLGHQALLG